MTERSSYRPGEPTWIDLGSPDLDASRAFYGALLGWEAGEGDEEFGGYSMFLKGGKQVAGLQPLMSPEQPPAWNCYVSVSDADQTVATVKRAGGQVHVEPMDVDDLGRMAFFADPAGGFLGIWQPREMTGAQLIQEEGTLGWIELSSRNLPGVLDFYSSVFGWSLKQDPHYTEFQLDGDSVAGGTDMPEMVPAEVQAFWMPYFVTADPRAKAEQAAGLGGTVLLPYGSAEGVEFSVAMDPGGASFGLLHMTA